MTHLPAGSTILQRRRGYREAFRHALRLRMASTLPIGDDDIRGLLEVHDIALLYEVWSFFAVVDAVSTVLGRPPANAARVAVAELGARVPRGLRVAWGRSVALSYNPRYSHGVAARRSYSLALRPDIVLRVRFGDEVVDHVFDAKFRLRSLADALPDGEDAEGVDEAEERRGVFKHGDLYKMHTYRDALPSTRTAWVVFPGTESRFFDAAMSGTNLEGLSPSSAGVGAVPLVPGSDKNELRRLLAGLLGEHVPVTGATPVASMAKLAIT